MSKRKKRDPGVLVENPPERVVRALAGKSVGSIVGVMGLGVYTTTDGGDGKVLVWEL